MPLEGRGWSHQLDGFAAARLAPPHERRPNLRHWLGGARREGGLHRLRRPKGSENLDGRDRRERELGRDILGNGRQPEDAHLHHATRGSDLLKIATAVVLAAERQLAPGHSPVHSARPALELSPDCSADEVRAIREEALVHKEVNLTQIDQPDVDRDLLALIAVRLASRTRLIRLHLVTSLPPSIGMVLGWQKPGLLI